MTYQQLYTDKNLKNLIAQQLSTDNPYDLAEWANAETAFDINTGHTCLIVTNRSGIQFIAQPGDWILKSPSIGVVVVTDERFQEILARREQ